MTSLEKKVQASQINSQQELEKYYFENIEELSTRIDQNVTIFGVIEDRNYSLTHLILTKKLLKCEDIQAVAS